MAQRSSPGWARGEWLGSSRTPASTALQLLQGTGTTHELKDTHINAFCHAHSHLYTHRHTHSYSHSCTHAHTRLGAHTDLYPYPPTLVHTHVQTFAHLHSCHSDTCTHTHMTRPNKCHPGTPSATVPHLRTSSSHPLPRRAETALSPAGSECSISSKQGHGTLRTRSSAFHFINN